MKSWASIVKTTPAPAAPPVVPASTAPAQQQGDIFILLPPKIQTKKKCQWR